ncbi:type II toxin-antitoxin system PemK/MazF family toxin [Acetobacter syzygii]|uniref:type II toxin-antitoxin system PemK/MazF family toxin n=1 Tax=Acetobacter syzygii TaxID=146476 RepID=UPI0039E7E91E
MSIEKPPSLGQILLCDFREGFKEPEMVKRRPVVVVSPQISWRPGLCTVVALSTTPPDPKRPYHCLLILDPPPPEPWSQREVWVKADLIMTVGFHRLDLIRGGRNPQNGKRNYYTKTLSAEQLVTVRRCILSGLGLFPLTKHL